VGVLFAYPHVTVLLIVLILAHVGTLGQLLAQGVTVSPSDILNWLGTANTITGALFTAQLVLQGLTKLVRNLWAAVKDFLDALRGKPPAPPPPQAPQQQQPPPQARAA
jgi:hypothetical protein